MVMSAALDTSREARDAQIDGWRRMSGTEKLTLVDDLCRAVDLLARAGIARDHPGATEREILWHLASRRYGSPLADAAFGRRAGG
jgi:hypothetical protein